MELKDIAREFPTGCGASEPILLPVVWRGNGRPPKGNRDCFHALLYVPVCGIPWEMLPRCFPSYKTIPRRLKRWSHRDVLRTARRQPAERYEQLHGINGDQVLLDGSEQPSKQGVNRPARRRSTGPVWHGPPLGPRPPGDVVGGRDHGSQHQ